MTSTLTPTNIDYDFTPESHDVTNTSQQSSAITTGSGLVRIAVSTHTHVAFGSNPTATLNDVMVPEHTVEIFRIKSGDKIAFIHHGTAGKINISTID
jgi:hypothetical protein